jgi:hypothetical protein
LQSIGLPLGDERGYEGLRIAGDSSKQIARQLGLVFPLPHPGHSDLADRHRNGKTE